MMRETRLSENLPRPPVELVAFYLPQYHPIPENDDWWGSGFTEWTNVAKTQPRFPNHYQPHIPADLGFYDLRDPAARESQARLAAEYGIGAFCYFHYWFEGRRLLSRPFNEVLRLGQPDFPFCLCWANESWTRTWDGGDRNILIEQNYSEEDAVRHIAWLVRAFDDPRYFRVDGLPLFLVYRATDLPEPQLFTEIWRREARRHGLGELYLARIESFSNEKGNPADVGCDGAVEFQPDWETQPDHFGVFDYRELAERALSKPWPDYDWFRCVTPSWDNSPRRTAAATIYDHSTPTEYGRWLSRVLRQTRAHTNARQVVFVNAWNEWGEGNHLEPCKRWGTAYLEATRTALLESRREPGI
jgi:lipopolysaccharide biosynthesis protein